ncbi:MAG: ornithine cyclodeaminase family protein [Proteobacteria bacterium]|nr:ornithine cyclodeaminase family protein [Pseudomonadota bacterium]
MRVLSEAETRELLTVEAAFRVVEAAYREYGLFGTVLANPSAAVMFVPADPPAIFINKMAMLPGQGVAGMRFGMQFGSYYCLVSEARTGKAIGLVDETWSYRRRVGATAAVSAKYLAPKRVKRIGLIGAGQLNEEVYLMMPHAFPGAEFRVSSRTLDGARDFARRLGTNRRPPLIPVATAEEAARDADIVVTITLAQAPMIRPGMLKAGALMLSMGGVAEITFECLPEFGTVVVDDLDYALLRGDFAAWVNAGLMTREQVVERIDANIGEVVAGRKPGRRSAGERVLGVIQGMAHCDVACAKYCLEEAARRGLGTVVESIAQSAGRDPAKGAKSAAFVTAGLRRSRGI